MEYAANSQTEPREIWTSEPTNWVEIPVYVCKLVRDSSALARMRTIKTTTEAVEILRRYLDGADREYMVVVLLDSSAQIIGVHTAYMGTLDHAAVRVAEIFKPAIIANAAAILVAHNHPSGNPEPSRADLQTTASIVRAGNDLSIAVLDSLIVGDQGRFVSIRETAGPIAGF